MYFVAHLLYVQSIINLRVDYVSYRNNPLICQSKVVSRKVLAVGSCSDSQSSSKACRLPYMLHHVMLMMRINPMSPAKVFVFVCVFLGTHENHRSRPILAMPSVAAYLNYEVPLMVR